MTKGEKETVKEVGVEWNAVRSAKFYFYRSTCCSFNFPRKLSMAVLMRGLEAVLMNQRDNIERKNRFALNEKAEAM